MIMTAEQAVVKWLQRDIVLMRGLLGDTLKIYLPLFTIYFSSFIFIQYKCCEVELVTRRFAAKPFPL